MRDTRVVAKKRGSETVADMGRSMGLLLVFVVVAYLLARPPGSDSKQVRVIQTGAAVQSALQSGENVLAPQGLASGWRATSAYVRPDDGSPVTRLHLGYVTPSDHYAEIEQVSADAKKFLSDLVSGADPTGQVDIAGAAWQVYRHDSDTTLTRTTTDGVLVLVNGDAGDTELRALAQALQPAQAPVD